MLKDRANGRATGYNESHMPRAIKTYAMSGATETLGFAIRDQNRVTRTEAPHRHEFFQMRLDLAGKAYHNIGSQRRVLAPGSVSFVLPYRIHRGGRRANSEFYVINFHHRFLRPEMDIDPLCVEPVSLANTPELAPFVFQEILDFRLDGADLAMARDACLRMMEHSASNRLLSVEIVRASLFLLIGLVCQRHEKEIRGLASSGTYGGGAHRSILPAVSRYISVRMADRISLADVAAAVRLSPSNLTRLLKRETGKTFTQLLTERRLQRAQELLTNTTMRIAEIGEAVGFEDNAYFARRFKQYLRMPPRVYRSSPSATAGWNSPK